MHVLKRLAVKAYASLHIGTLLSGPTLYANTKCGSTAYLIAVHACLYRGYL